MSETPIESFSELKGLEANQHAKELAKKKSKKKAKKYQVFYSKSGNKVISFMVKPNGVYRSYVGNLLKKKEAQFLKTQIEIWKKEKVWIDEPFVKEFVEKELKKVS